MNPQHAILRPALRCLRAAGGRRPTTSRHLTCTSPSLCARRQHNSTTRAPHAQQTSTNPPLSFPCLDAVESRTASLSSRWRSSTSGPEPSYTTGAHQTFHSPAPLLLDWGGILPSFDIAYETWGTLDAAAGNAILLHTGLSGSSHARSTAANAKRGWWERFVGPGCAIDTDVFYVICTNVIGGCFGSTGPASVDPASVGAGGVGGGERYATRFPILTVEDMVRAQFRLLDHLGIERLYASVGSSMGGMQSLAAAVLENERVGRVVSVSGCARSHPYSIAMRFTQRQVLMMDPNWRRGFYYTSGVPPHAGMKLAREIATVTYRSGPEWGQRFGRRRADPSKPPALCPDFLIETYLDHAGEKFCLEYDANSLLYVSKAMDLFDLGARHREMIDRVRRGNEGKLKAFEQSATAPAPRLSSGWEENACTLTLPDQPYEEQDDESAESPAESLPEPSGKSNTKADPPPDLVLGMTPMKDTPTLVLGVKSDILFPSWQQREVADALRAAGNTQVQHVELGEDKSLFGHDTFLLDLEGVGGAVGRFLAEGRGR